MSVPAHLTATMHDVQPSAASIAPEHPADVDLAARAAKGDELAFGCIMRRHNQLLYRTARSILKSDDETEDALQEAYLRCCRRGWCES